MQQPITQNNIIQKRVRVRPSHLPKKNNTSLLRTIASVTSKLTLNIYELQKYHKEKTRVKRKKSEQIILANRELFLQFARLHRCSCHQILIEQVSKRTASLHPQLQWNFSSIVQLVTDGASDYCYWNIYDTIYFR